MKKLLNYFGQLRVYSLLDVVVFATALTADRKEVLGVVLVWMGFIFYLEGVHKDRLRSMVNPLVWLVFFVPSVFLLPVYAPVLFMIFGVFYTNKKRGKFWGATSIFWRAAQNFILALPFSVFLAVLAFVLTALRNLVGDFRDAASDVESKASTLPVLLGAKRNQVWAFYAHLGLVMLATIIWFQFSYLPSAVMWPVIILEIVTYPLTPRESNPGYLNFYRRIVEEV